MNNLLKFALGITIIMFLITSCGRTNENKVFLDSEYLELVAGDFAFTEGPTSDGAGNIYFTDQPYDKIYKYDLSSGLSVFMENSGRANGLYFDNRNQLWICADEANKLLKYSFEEDSIYLMATKQSNKHFNGPNDVWVHKRGYVYFTDPMYQRPYWKNKHDTLVVQGLYYLGQEGEIVVMDSTLFQPNGIVGDSKKNLLYVADIGDNKTYSYTITANGQLTNKSLFVNMGSDGMTIDDSGNLYLTGEGVFVFNSEGMQIDHLKVPEPWTANVCFGGSDNNELYITASKGLYKIKTMVVGVK